MKSGDFVKFVWWSTYKAPSIYTDHNGYYSWHEIEPESIGIVVCSDESDSAVLFSNISCMVRIHNTMLKVI